MGNSIFRGNQSPNPLFGLLGNNFQQNFANFAMQFKQNNMQSPEQVVRNMLSSGQMSQEQFNQFSLLANQIMGRR